MNTYNSSLTSTYSERHPSPLNRNEASTLIKDARPVTESIQAGQQFIGEILNRTTTDVTVRLSNGHILQARLDVSVPLSIGQTASFEVTHADPALISLRILQTENTLAKNALVQKALSAAELPVTARNTEIVTALLQHNLPISKDSILSLSRQSNAYPNADIRSLALMTQHKIPITQSTLTQYEAYRNYEHQLLPRLENLAQSLGELVSASDASTPSLSGLFRTVQRLIQNPVETPQPSPAQFEAAKVPASVITDMPATTQTTSDGTTADLSTASSVPVTDAAFTDAVDSHMAAPSAPVTDTAVADTADSHMVAPSAPVTDTVVADTADSRMVAPPAQATDAAVTDTVDSHMAAPPAPLTDAAVTDTADSHIAAPSAPLTDAAVTDTADSRMTAPSAPLTDAAVTDTADSRMAAPSASLTDTSVTDTADSRMAAPSASLTDSATETAARLFTRWTLSPKDFSTPEKLSDFYKRLREDLNELHTVLRSLRKTGASDNSPLERLLSDTTSATQQLQENLEFMHMLNRIFPYVQLPIRLSDKTTHGELYVYTKKEKLRSKDNSLSVLLHLDMESLGPTDIFLSLTGNQLTSRFYLNDPALEDLFTQHLPTLKETLSEKGFSVNFEFIARQQESDPVREFLNTHDTSGLSRFSFDCRA